MDYALLLFVIQQTSPIERTFLEYGLLGAIVIILAYVVLRLFKILLVDRDKAITQRDELLEKYFVEVAPTLNENARVIAELTEVLKENTRVLSRVDYQGGR